MGVLEMPHGTCSVGRRKGSERLSQCLACGALLWSHDADGEPQCRCSIVSVMRDLAKEPQLLGTSA